MLDIIFEDKDMLVINKAAGQLSQSGKSFDKDIVSEVMAYRKLKRGEEPYAAIINRLDRPVSGLVLIAKNKSAAARLTQDLRKNGQKDYVAAVIGNAAKILGTQKGILKDVLVKDERNNVSYALSDNNSNQSLGDGQAKEASLEYEITDYDTKADISYIRIHLITGRHHQIRVQLSSRGLNIVGDYKYLSDIGRKEQMDSAVSYLKLRRNQIALCAYHLFVEGKDYEIGIPFINV